MGGNCTREHYSGGVTYWDKCGYHGWKPYLTSSSEVLDSAVQTGMMPTWIKPTWIFKQLWLAQRLLRVVSCLAITEIFMWINSQIEVWNKKQEKKISFLSGNCGQQSSPWICAGPWAIHHINKWSRKDWKVASFLIMLHRITQNQQKLTVKYCITTTWNRTTEQMKRNTDVNCHMWRKTDLALNTQQLFLTYCSAKRVMIENFTQTTSIAAMLSSI